MNRNRWRGGALALAGSLLCSSAAAAAPGVGDQAPELGIETLLRGPDGVGTTWADLEGKVVLVEFWATWCAPCIAAFPHLNEIVHAVADRDDIVLIAVTDEKREKIEKFLKKKQLDTWVGLDTDRSSFKAYGITGIPQTLIVGKDGRIAAITYPTLVTADHLIQVAEGNPIDLPSLSDMVGGRGEVVGGEADNGAEHVKRGSGMQMDPNAMREYALGMTEPGDAHERMGFLAGQWRVEKAFLMGAPAGGGDPIAGTMTWRWSGDGRYLVGTSTIGQDPAVESIRIMGWDSQENAYYLYEFNPMNPEPVVWSGVWDDAGSMLVFAYEQEIKIMGGPGGGGDPPVAMMTLIIRQTGESGFEMSSKIRFPEDGPKMLGMSGEQVISTTTGIRLGGR